MMFECLLDDSALYARAASVDQADFTKARELRGVDVFLDNRSDVAWGEGVEVESRLDREPVGHAAV